MRYLRPILMAVSLVLFGLYPVITQADGMVVPKPQYWVQETGQKAAILYENGTETLVISTTFQGNANDFAWIVPVPGKPTVTKGSDELFTNLEKLTQIQNQPQPMYSGVLGLDDRETNSGVTVIETKQVDYYDVAVLSATDKDSLVNWLKDNEYSLPDSASYLLSQYIQDKWFFVAMKINPQALEWTNVSQQLRNGHATPVVFSFATDKMVYPLRISKPFSSESDDTTTSTRLSLVTGKFGKAVSLSTGQTMTFAAKGFPTTAGTIEMQVKPTVIKMETCGNQVLLSASEPPSSTQFQFRVTKDCSTHLSYLEYEWQGQASTSGGTTISPVYIWRSSSPVTMSSTSWSHVAVSWSATQQPTFYVNGIAFPANSQSSVSQWVGSPIGVQGRMTLGGLISSTTQTFQGVMDEVVVWNQALTAEQIAARAKTELALVTPQLYDEFPDGASLSTPPSGVSIYGSFNTSVDLIDGSGTSIMRYHDTWYPTPITSSSSSSSSSSSVYYPSQNITLYVFSNERKDATGFSTSYANWFSKKSIENLAFATTGAPLLAPKDKMFLTVMQRTISSTATLDDVFFRSASTQQKIGTAPDYVDNSGIKFWIFLGAVLLLTLGLAVTLLVWNHHPKKLSTNPPQQLN
jgi:hypothetical protein